VLVVNDFRFEAFSQFIWQFEACAVGGQNQLVGKFGK
jgi:hypothetical protein